MLEVQHFTDEHAVHINTNGRVFNDVGYYGREYGSEEVRRRYPSVDAAILAMLTKPIRARCTLQLAFPFPFLKQTTCLTCDISGKYQMHSVGGKNLLIHQTLFAS